MTNNLIDTHDVSGVVDSIALRTVFGRFPSGVTALCAVGEDGQPIGMAVSAFVGVSLDPPLVGVCLQRTSTTWPRLSARPRVGLSVLGSSQRDACHSLATRDGDRFAELRWTATDDGAILLDGAAAWMDCEIESHYPAGDHDMVMLRIHRHLTHSDTRPLVFYGSKFHGLGDLDAAV